MNQTLKLINHLMMSHIIYICRHVNDIPCSPLHFGLKQPAPVHWQVKLLLQLSDNRFNLSAPCLQICTSKHLCHRIHRFSKSGLIYNLQLIFRDFLREELQMSSQGAEHIPCIWHLMKISCQWLAWVVSVVAGEILTKSHRPCIGKFWPVGLGAST